MPDPRSDELSVLIESSSRVGCNTMSKTDDGMPKRLDDKSRNEPKSSGILSNAALCEESGELERSPSQCEGRRSKM